MGYIIFSQYTSFTVCINNCSSMNHESVVVVVIIIIIIISIIIIITIMYLF